MRILYIFCFLSFPLYAQYCIQVISYNDSLKEKLILQIQKPFFKQFQHVRVEHKKPYYTLRIGDYTTLNQGKKDLEKIKTQYKDAFLRTCNFQKKTTQTVTNKKKIQKQQIKQKIQKRQTPLLDACQQCFAPMFIEENN